jgi:hypothetical protein
MYAFISKYESRECKRTKRLLRQISAGLIASASIASAWAQSAPAPTPPAPPAPASFPCGGTNPVGVQLKPVPKLSNGEFTNAGADCAMWQTFIYLNWPAKPGPRGVPDTSQMMGAPGMTVWESFLTSDQVFLPNGATPQPWNSAWLRLAAHPLMGSTAPKALANDAGAGKVRVLARSGKVSQAVAKLRTSLAANSPTNIPLDEIKQADGNTLYDQQKNPVYYDVAMNKVQYDYIATNKLYNAGSQATFATKKNIILPQGSIEVKAAWKMLTAAEAASGRFHMAKGYVPGGNVNTVPIGLVGFHVFASGGAQNAGLWATFYQIDNAPLLGKPGTQSYSFFNAASTTPVNTKGTNPTQVAQVFPDDATGAGINKEAQQLFIKGNPKSPWQYYAMIDTQWSKTVLNLNQPIPLTAPVSPGKPGDISTNTLINPVLETFMQTQNNSCMGCHSFATTATGFSFMFGNAQGK